MKDTPFHDLGAHVDSPMYVVTAAADGEHDGCLVGFATQCSIDPTRFLVCLSTANRTFAIASRAETRSSSTRCYERTTPLRACSVRRPRTTTEVDKFVSCDWTPGPGGAPVLDGCDWFAGNIHDRVELGDHVGFVLDVTRSR